MLSLCLGSLARVVGLRPVAAFTGDPAPVFAAIHGLHEDNHLKEINLRTTILATIII